MKSQARYHYMHGTVVALDWKRCGWLSRTSWPSRPLWTTGTSWTTRTSRKTSCYGDGKKLNCVIVIYRAPVELKEDLALLDHKEVRGH